MLVLIAAAQGAAVFVTAWLGLRVLKTPHPLAKIMAMAISLAVWIGATMAGYLALGGDGGFMDGVGLLLSLCRMAAISSSAYLAAWIVGGLAMRSRGARRPC